MIDGLGFVEEMPHTLLYVLSYRMRIDSFGELPKDKRPPRDLWDKSYKLEEFLDSVWDSDKDKNTSDSKFIEFNLEDVE